jgi:uncharacterized protein (DUF58 family)
VIARATPLAFALATVMAWMLVIGLMIDRAEPFIAAIPLGVALLGLGGRTQPPCFELRQAISADRTLEGDRVVVTVSVAADVVIPIIEVLAALPALVELEASTNRMVLAVHPGVTSEWRFTLRLPARGRFDLGRLYVRISHRSGLAVFEGRCARPQPISVYPHAAPIRHVPRPVRTQFSFGNYVSPRLGEGIEPGDIRPFLPGDRTRHINWRASLRRQQLYVTQFHEERNADVVLLLDALSDVGAPPCSTLDASVRAAAALAHAYLARKDRVGFIEFGGYLRWIDPGSGRRQGEALIEALLPASTHFSYVVPQLDRLPPRVLPPQALVIALTPLLDERFAGTLIDLAARGFDVIVVAVSPIEPTRHILDRSLLDDVACRLWAVEWRVRSDELRRRGLMIFEWKPEVPLEAVLAPLARSRPRFAGRR